MKNREIQAHKLAFMTHQEMSPEKWDKLIEDKKIRDENKYEPKLEASTDKFTCRKCYSKKCTYYQLQTRSADEPMTTFVTCLDCGKPCPQSRCQDCAAQRLISNPRPRFNSAARGYDRDWQKMRTLILNRDGWICYRCGRKLKGTDATVDHITPLSKDREQRLNPANLAACCRSCNSSKKDK
jgi:DNA-directed RNA polymerase subunit M/transcription elongation factor TFIIS